MGGEGTPVKTKTPLGQTNAVDDPMAMNSHSNSRDAGTDGNARGIDGTGLPNAASLEASTDGKQRRTIRKTPSHPHAQATCLRQILLLQLDLIEQQQQELQTKDKEIDELKSDRDTLLARIERMERRLQLISNAPRNKRLFQPLERWQPDSEDFWEGGEEAGQAGPPKDAVVHNNKDGKVQKRKLCTSEPKLPAQKPRGKAAKLSQKADRHDVVDNSAAGSPPPLPPQQQPPLYHRDVHDIKQERHSPEPPHSRHEPPLSHSHHSHHSHRQPAGQASPVLRPVRSTRDHDAREEPAMEDLPYMTTTEMYLCCWKQPPLSPLLETSPCKEEDVDIPSWRERSVEPLHDIEASDIPENTEDNVFLKRHLKHELDEKRRKRWDIQRFREQRMLQRLQQRMEKKAPPVPETEPDLISFYPEMEDVESIIITPFLPVMAFGRPLPNLAPENFELPWLDDRSRCRVENQKKTAPHRNCRK